MERSRRRRIRWAGDHDEAGRTIGSSQSVVITKEGLCTHSRAPSRDALSGVTAVAEAQIIVTPMGNITDISGPNGQSSTQVDLGNGQGVIITNQSTTPYTTLGQLSTPSQFGVPSVPSAPRVGTPAAPSSPAPLFLPGGGSDSPVIILGK